MSVDYQPSAPIDEPELLAEAPGWPKVVGIISIVWSSLGMFCGVCAIGGGYFAVSMMPAEQRSQFPPNMLPSGLMLVVAALSMLSGVLLIVAGVVTLRRNPLGGKLHIAYAVLAILLSAANIYLQIGQQADLAQWARENPDTMFAKQMQSPGQQVGQTVGYAVGAIMGFAYPIFLLIWFGAVKRRPETWGSRAEARARI